MNDDPTQTRARLDIDWLKTVAGALAAVSSAVLLSTLGAAGTLVGAAVGSIVATVGGALYTHGLATSRQKLAHAQAIARDKVGIAQAEVRRANRAEDTQAQESHLEHADERLAEAHGELDAIAEETTPAPWRQRLSALPWKRIALAAAGLFVAVVVAITVFEMLAGRSVSSFTGGSGKDQRTTVGTVRGGDGDRDRRDRPDRGGSESPTPDQSGGASTEPGDEPGEEPSEEPSDPASDPTDGGVSETPTPTGSPDGSGTATPSPSPTPSAGP